MFHVTTLEKALSLASDHFSGFTPKNERVRLNQALGRYLSAPVGFSEFIPDFSRSTVDGYGVRAEDVRGCSESNPGILRLIGSVEIGKGAKLRIDGMTTVMVPTGAELPLEQMLS
jgi:molybdopterin molybdotransferase